MTPQEFRAARRKLGLSSSQMARTIGISDARQIRRYETAPELPSHRPVPPFLAVLVNVLLRSPQARALVGLR